MLNELPERIIAIDWSGRKDVSGQRKHIWAASWMRKEITLEAGRTREELIAWLIDESRKTPRMVVGVDFCFSYPAWFLKDLGMKSAPEFWELVSKTHSDLWLSTECADERFWGRPKKKPAQFCTDNEKMFRRADLACKVRSHIIDPIDSGKVKGIAPKSPFQIGGAGAVGTGTLKGIPVIQQLRTKGFRVWPFDPPSFPLIIEIYPRLLTGEVKKSQKTARTLYLAERRKKDRLFRELPNSAVKKAESSEDAFDALVSMVEMVRNMDTFPSLKKSTDLIVLLEGAVWGAGDETHSPLK